MILAQQLYSIYDKLDVADWLMSLKDNGTRLSAVKTDKDGYLLGGDKYRWLPESMVFNGDIRRNYRKQQNATYSWNGVIWSNGIRQNEYANWQGRYGHATSEKRPVVVTPTVKIEAKDQPKIAP